MPIPQPSPARRLWKRLPAAFRKFLLRCLYGPDDADRVRKISKQPNKSVRVLGREFHYLDPGCMRFVYHEIFTLQTYRVDGLKPEPFILDIGANIGLSLLYFKQRHPGARIIAFEADPEIFRTLEQNHRTYGWTGVTLHNQAVSHRAGTFDFRSQLDASGRLTESGDGNIRVPAVRLRPFLEEPVDILKLDVEGAELDILEDCENLLHRVGRIFVEYHKPLDQPCRLAELLLLLRRCGFDYTINRANSAYKGSAMVRKNNPAFTYSVDIAAWRA